jgi:hypothetical protein
MEISVNKIHVKAPKLRITGCLRCAAVAAWPTFCLVRSGYALTHTAKLRHIPTRRNPAGCFIGGLERRIQPEHYVQLGEKFGETAQVAGRGFRYYACKEMETKFTFCSERRISYTRRYATFFCPCFG